MFRLLALGCLLPALAAALAAQSPSATLTAGTVIKADVVAGFNTADSQVGDQVSVASTEDIKQGKFKLPKGTTFAGRVMKVATATDRNSEASITLLFDSATTPKGNRYAIKTALASVTVKAASSGGGFGRGGGYGGGGYGRRRGMGGPPPASGGATASSPQIAVRFPADAATTGSVLSSQHGDFWVYPQTHVTLQVVANAPPAPAGN